MNRNRGDEAPWLRDRQPREDRKPYATRPVRPREPHEEWEQRSSGWGNYPTVSPPRPAPSGNAMRRPQPPAPPPSRERRSRRRVILLVSLALLLALLLPGALALATGLRDYSELKTMGLSGMRHLLAAK